MSEALIVAPDAIQDWDDAYANSAHIPGAEDYIAQWETQASVWRNTALSHNAATLNIAYGSHPREQYDLFYPATQTRGLVVFVHGGYWLRFDRSYWSHLAQGAVENGYTVMMPSYRLCPDTTIADITRQITVAITHAYRAVSDLAGNRAPNGKTTALPLKLAGHSAGGQIVSRLVCEDSELPAQIQQAIDVVLSISGVHDLRPLLKTTLNQSLQLNPSTAFNASPALQTPNTNARVYCVAGTLERPEFIRQTQLLPLCWYGLGVSTTSWLVEHRHHFDIIEDLCDAESTMTSVLLST